MNFPTSKLAGAVRSAAYHSCLSDEGAEGLRDPYVLFQHTVTEHTEWALDGKDQYLGYKDDPDRVLAYLTELVG